jgi:hypothetical protein
MKVRLLLRFKGKGGASQFPENGSPLKRSLQESRGRRGYRRHQAPFPQTAPLMLSRLFRWRLHGEHGVPLMHQGPL